MDYYPVLTDTCCSMDNERFPLTCSVKSPDPSRFPFILFHVAVTFIKILSHSIIERTSEILLGGADER